MKDLGPIFEPRPFSDTSWMPARTLVRYAHSSRKNMIRYMKAGKPDEARSTAMYLWCHLRMIANKRHAWPISWRPEKYLDSWLE